MEESTKSTPQLRVKKSRCLPLPGSFRTAGRLTVDDRTDQESFPVQKDILEEEDELVARGGEGWRWYQLTWLW